MRSRMLTLMLAVVTGAAAVAIVYLYVQSVEQESARGQDVVTVLVADQTLTAGMKWADIVASGSTREEKIPQRFVVTGALGSTQDLPGGVLARDIVEGEQVTQQAFASNAQNAFAAQFEKGTEALALPVERVRGVAGHVVADDRLNAFRTTENGTELIARRIKVVEVQPPTDGDPTGLETMVLEVERPEAVALINAQEQAGLWFTLVTDGGL